MLQAIRDGSKGIVAKIIVGLIILTFALFGIESIVALGGGQDAPATVNGEDISELQVQQATQMQKRRLQSQFGENFDPAIFKDELIRDSSIETLISETLMKQAAKDAGIMFSDAEIDALIVKSPDFQVGGKFDRNQFDLVLRSAGFTRATYRELLRTSVLTQQLQNAWQSTSFATPYEAKQTAMLEAQTRNFAFTTFALENFKKDVIVSDEEIQAYYDENTQDFMTQEKVSLKYVELEADKLGKSIEITDDEVQERYDAIVAESNSNKEYRAAHILLLDASDEAKAKMADIQAQLNAGKSFEELAKEFSEDDTSKFSGGDLGFAGAEVYESEFADALVQLQVGDVSSVVETRDGLHLIKLLEERQPEVAELSDMQDSIKEELRAEAVRVVYLEALETLKNEAFSSYQIEPVAATLELEVKNVPAFARTGGQGIAADRNVIEAAFSDNVLNEGANSDVIELSDSRAVVVHLDQYFESKAKELSEVRSQINTLLIAQKAAEQLEAKAQEALAQAKSGEFNADWSAFTDKTRQFTGANQEVVSRVFAMGLNSEGAANYELVELQNGDKALVKLESINRDAEFEVTESQSQKVSRTKSNGEFKAFFEYNREEADIEKS